MRADIKKKAKTCSACRKYEILKPQIPSTKKSKIEPPKNRGKDVETDFTGNLNSEILNSFPFILIPVDEKTVGRQRNLARLLTGLVQKTIQSMTNLIKANLEENQNIRESLNRALYVLRFTTHSEKKENAFRTTFLTEPWNRGCQIEKYCFI